MSLRQDPHFFSHTLYSSNQILFNSKKAASYTNLVFLIWEQCRGNKVHESFMTIKVEKPSTVTPSAMYYGTNSHIYICIKLFLSIWQVKSFKTVNLRIVDGDSQWFGVSPLDGSDVTWQNHLCAHHVHIFQNPFRANKIPF